jgi:hypothetical protein
MMTTAHNNRPSATNWRMGVRLRSLILAELSRDRRRRHMGPAGRGLKVFGLDQWQGARLGNLLRNR